MTGQIPRPVAEVDITEPLVRSLVASARPDLAGMDLEEVGAGWDNSVWRLGSDLSVRVPRRLAAVPLLVNEQMWLPRLVDRLPLPVPAPVVVGTPTREYPWPWSICRWVPGRAWADDPPTDEPAAAVELARFLRALHVPAPSDAPRSEFRGGSLRSREAPIRARAETVRDQIDIDPLLATWSRVLAVPGVDIASGTWVHGDLHPLNLACHGGAVSGVLDFGDLTAGDPAVDLSVGWTVLGADGRRALFESYRADAAAVARSAGWALNHGLACLAGSADHPVVAGIGRRTLERLVEAPPV